jgi:hypothetical protein
MENASYNIIDARQLLGLFSRSLQKYFKEIKLLVLIDETGCPGFKLTKGSTPYFIIAMVIFKDFKESEKASEAIRNLRETKNIRPEFKFNKCCATVKDTFFETVCKYNFQIFALVVDKSIIYSNHLRTKTDSFYNYFVKNLMKYDHKLLTNAVIKIDGSGDKEFKNSLSIYLRKELGQGKIKKFSFADSKKIILFNLQIW